MSRILIGTVAVLATSGVVGLPGATAATSAAAKVAPVASAVVVPAVDLPYGPDTCVNGFVWREARPDDHVCVTPETRTLTAEENAAAESRRDPGHGGYGPLACAVPYVWREAFDGDAVCVPVDRRTQARDDNAHAAERFVRNQQTQEKVQDKLGNALSQWMDANHVANASMAVMNQDVLVGEFDKGDQSGAEAPAPLASLSKAVTAVGVMTLIDDGRLTFDTTVAKLPQDFLTRTGLADHLDTFGAVTIGDLLRHRSGLTYDPVAANLLVGVPDTDDADLVLIKEAFGKPLGTRGKEVYNNVNYAILGRLISSMTGEGYESYVKRMVLAPRGAPGAHIEVRALGAYGGWVMSPVEYAQFARAFSPGARLLSQRAHTFIDAMAVADKGTYALGVVVKKPTQGRNLWHFGNWPGSTAVPQKFGSYFAMWNNGIAVTVAVDTNLSDSQQASLDTALRNAAGIA
ncbi:serine hydrolase domain-containing protein [Pseudonocardia sp. CA-107938]|uniref:serine hydrolase domain-containing protein n=1 Tax=Pseudonocardia sp. CA-107938 TaxID=3240021 RepID=UPI003D939F42